MNGLVKVLLVAALSIVAFASPVTAFAEEGPEEKSSFKDGWALLGPAKDVLSGPAWLMAEELGPGSEAFGNEPEETFQGPGGAGMGLVPYRNPAPAFSRNLLVTRDFGIPVQTEPHVAVNPNDPNHVVVTAIDYASVYNPVYVSFDAGVNWQGPNRVPISHGSVLSGDPALAFGSDGRVFQVAMDLDLKSYKVGSMLFSIPVSKIVLAGSEDGGLHWQEAVVMEEAGIAVKIDTDDAGRLRGSVGFSFPDKPWLAIGPDPKNPDQDIIYVTYTVFLFYYQIVYIGDVPILQFRFLQSLIAESSSRDGGKTWSEPQAVSPIVNGFELDPKSALEEIDVRVVQGSFPQVAPDGKVFVSWYDSLQDGSERGKARINLSWSEDGGATWKEPVVAAEFLDVARHPRSARFRHNSHGQLALGGSGEIYLVFVGGNAQKPSDDGDVYFVRSLDRGKSFNQPQRLNQDQTDRLQFFPALATDSKGNVHVMWGDMRDDPGGLRYHIYYTKSLDRGENWGFDLPERGIHEPDTRVTDFSSNPNRGFPQGRFIGDYFAIAAASEDEVYMVWADTRLGEYGPMNQKIGFARRKAIPSPEVFLNPASGPGGQEVTLQAFNFQHELNVFVRIGGSVVFAGQASQEGQTTFRMFIPVAGEGAHDVVVFDESGNTAIGSFYMDFGFGNLADRQTQQAAEDAEQESQLQKSVDNLQDNIRLLIRVFVAGAVVLAIGAAAYRVILWRKRRSK